MKVLLSGKVVEMSENEIRERGVLGGPDWDRQRQAHEVSRGYRELITSMDLDGSVFHEKIGRRVALSAKDRSDETAFSEMFERQDNW